MALYSLQTSKARSVIGEFWDKYAVTDRLTIREKNWAQLHQPHPGNLTRRVALKLAAASLFHATHATGVPKTCTDYNIPVNITSTNLIFGLPQFKDNFGVADFINIDSSRDTNVRSSVVSNRTESVTATYTISATFCRPGLGAPGPNAKKAVLLATHGLGYDPINKPSSQKMTT
ncbi:hypothetical protein QBC43DRAFT_337217 [Cladorrhinum sp. PSN259]|nr:hypothetical protein QBC43DRAFT_337217 [Cladorrhinum sp. PSN259]